MSKNDNSCKCFHRKARHVDCGNVLREENIEGRKERSRIGRSSHTFLSHAWRYDFKTLMSALDCHFEGKSEEKLACRVWNDIL